MAILIVSVMVLTIMSALVPSIRSVRANSNDGVEMIVLVPFDDDSKELEALREGKIDIYVSKSYVTESRLQQAGIDPNSVYISNYSRGIAVMLFNTLRDSGELASWV